MVRFQVFKITNNDNDGNVPVDNGDNVIAIAIHFNKWSTYLANKTHSTPDILPTTKASEGLKYFNIIYQWSRPQVLLHRTLLFAKTTTGPWNFGQNNRLVSRYFQDFTLMRLHHR